MHSNINCSLPSATNMVTPVFHCSRAAFFKCSVWWEELWALFPQHSLPIPVSVRDIFSTTTLLRGSVSEVGEAVLSNSAFNSSKEPLDCNEKPERNRKEGMGKIRSRMIILDRIDFFLMT